MNRGIAVHGQVPVDMVVSSIEASMHPLDLDFDVIDALDGAFGAILELMDQAWQNGDVYRFIGIYHLESELAKAIELLGMLHQMGLQYECYIVCVEADPQTGAEADPSRLKRKEPPDLGYYKRN